jgi:elongation factor Ts
VHAGGKLAVLIHAEGPDASHPELRAFTDNCAMQVAAMRPQVVRRDEVTAPEIAKQKEIFVAQLKEEGKPEAAWPKIVEGKIAKWFSEITLLGQDNVWDPTGGAVDKIRQELCKKLGGDVKIHSFVRFELGEGIEKPPEDFVGDVAKTIAG